MEGMVTRRQPGGCDVLLYLYCRMTTLLLLSFSCVSYDDDLPASWHALLCDYCRMFGLNGVPGHILASNGEAPA